jgi:hypothetical protein
MAYQDVFGNQEVSRGQHQQELLMLMSAAHPCFTSHTSISDLMLLLLA